MWLLLKTLFEGMLKEVAKGESAFLFSCIDELTSCGLSFVKLKLGLNDLSNVEKEDEIQSIKNSLQQVITSAEFEGIGIAEEIPQLLAIIIGEDFRKLVGLG